MNKPLPALAHHQRGVATLTVALILLVSLTLLTLFASRVSVTEHQIAANDYRAKQAFEAAQAGIEVAFTNAGLNGNLTQAPQGGGTPPLPTVPSTADATSGPRYSVSFSYPNVTNLQQIMIASTGYSSDKSATKLLRQALQYVPFQLAGVNAGILAMGNVSVRGSLTASNQGFADSYSIRTGGTYTPPNGNGTQIIGEVRTDNSISQDPDTFFKNIFGKTKETVKAQATQLSCSTPSGCNALLGGTQSQLIWLTGGANITGGAGGINRPSIGTADNPVVLIVDGPFSIAGNVQIYGMVYYTNNWGNNGRGTASVTGATVVEGTFDSQANTNYLYDPNVLRNLQDDLGTFEKLAGGWRDF